MKHKTLLARRAWQRGLTMVEILVAMVLMLLVTLATITLYSVNNQSFKTVDASQELNDNARFIFELIGQSVRVAGYQEYLPGDPAAKRAGNIYPATCTSATPPCPIQGFNNSAIADASVATTNYFGASGSNDGINASDTLAITFSGSSTRASAGAATAVPDGSIIDCQGNAHALPRDVADLALSVFYVRIVNGEPELACIARSSGGTRVSQPVVRGVETMQLMYGLDTDGTWTTPATLAPNRWVSAQDVGDWNRVRAIRVGLVLRGPAGSAQTPVGGGNLTTEERTYYPLGKEFVGSSSETGLKFTVPARPDGRLRRAYSTVFMLRNSAS